MAKIDNSYFLNSLKKINSNNKPQRKNHHAGGRICGNCRNRDQYGVCLITNKMVPSRASCRKHFSFKKNNKK